MRSPDPSPRIESVEDADPLTRARFDAVIDVRSPAEFAEDHVPGAINLPVLSNEERAVVGTIYVQDSRFHARRLGAAMIARNVALYLETELADRPGAFRPLIYCWRGGSRSNAMATILANVGWRTSVLAGGYRTYRREVTQKLYEAQPSLQVVLLDGHTGSGKTEILHRLAARGLQTLDLEGLAQHRGSLFGALPGRPQPSQKMFESRLLAAMESLDPARPVVIEAESSKIGERMVPPALWQAMAGAPVIELAAPLELRARHLAEAYRELADDRAALEAAFSRLPAHAGRLDGWRQLADAGDHEEIARRLMERHYDPAYRSSRRKAQRPVLVQIAIDAFDDQALDRAADQVAAVVLERAAVPALSNIRSGVAQEL